MASLFIFQSHFATSELESQIALSNPNDSLVFIEDGVRMLQQGSGQFSLLKSSSRQLYALETDCLAQGVQTDVQRVDYDQLVHLMTIHHPIVTL